MRPLFALVWLAALAGCGSPRPPAELGGLWSPHQSACAAGVGVRFTAGAIEAVYNNQREALFARPRYAVEAHGEAFRVRIRYRLPYHPGGARSVGARGEVVLVRVGEGVAPVSHNLLDRRTGAARARIANDPAASVLTLQPCGPHPWRGGMRGRQIARNP